MDKNVQEKENNVDVAQVIQEDSIEYKSGGFNRWGVNVENDSRSSRHSSIFNDFKESEESAENTEEDNLTPASAGELASTTFSENIPKTTQVEETTSVEPEPSEEESSDNFAYYVAKQMIEEGALPNFDDVDKDITFEDIYESYKETASELVMRDVMEKVQASLNTAGVTEENIVLLQAIQNGVPMDELYEVNKYQKYSSLDDYAEEDKKLEVIKEWYKSRNLSEKEIRRNLDAIELSDEIDSEFSDAKKFFADTIDNYSKAQRQIAMQEMEGRKAIQQMNEQILYNAVNQGVLAGEKLTKEQSKQIYKDIYEKSRVYNVDGEKVYLSPFEEYLYRINNDFEFQLLNYKNFAWRGSEIDVLRARAEEETEKDYLEAFKKAQLKSSSKASIKKNTQTQKDGYTVYTNETGGRTFEF
jgi:hypothetical protein